MPKPNRIRDQINERIERLVTIGLADEQLLAFRRERGNLVEITFPNAVHVTSALKDVAYEPLAKIGNRPGFLCRKPQGEGRSVGGT